MHLSGTENEVVRLLSKGASCMISNKPELRFPI